MWSSPTEDTCSCLHAVGGHRLSDPRAPGGTAKKSNPGTPAADAPLQPSGPRRTTPPKAKEAKKAASPVPRPSCRPGGQAHDRPQGVPGTCSRHPSPTPIPSRPRPDRRPAVGRRRSPWISTHHHHHLRQTGSRCTTCARGGVPAGAAPRLAEFWRVWRKVIGRWAPVRRDRPRPPWLRSVRQARPPGAGGIPARRPRQDLLGLADALELSGSDREPHVGAYVAQRSPGRIPSGCGALSSSTALSGHRPALADADHLRENLVPGWTDQSRLPLRAPDLRSGRPSPARPSPDRQSKKKSPPAARDASGERLGAGPTRGYIRTA